MKRTVSLLLIAVVAICLQGFFASTASAHHPTVTASASCVNGAAVISYTSISWDPSNLNNDGINPEIDILFNGNKVDMGAYTVANNFQFSGQKPAPLAALTVDVQAIAVGTWGDGFGPGDVSGIVTVTIPTNCGLGLGRFTGGGKQVDVTGLTITKGFEVDCDLHEPSNNLEINWQDASGSHHFHMEEFLSAACTFAGKPNPPTAPVNTIVATGTGKYDGTLGYTVEFTLIDNGEPGAGNDEAGFKVSLTADPSIVVLNFPLQFVTKGNIQAHVDQK